MLRHFFFVKSCFFLFLFFVSLNEELSVYLDLFEVLAISGYRYQNCYIFLNPSVYDKLYKIQADDNNYMKWIFKDQYLIHRLEVKFRRGYTHTCISVENNKLPIGKSIKYLFITVALVVEHFLEKILLVLKYVKF